MEQARSSDESKIAKVVSCQPGVFVKTFGCQMNEYDSEKMLLLMSDTHQKVEQFEDADVILVNTCSVREKGEQKLHSLLGRFKSLKKKKPHLVVGVGGCVAQQEGQSIIDRNPVVDFVIGTHNLSLIPGLVKQAREQGKKHVAIDYRDEWEELPSEFDVFPEHQTDSRPLKALVAIQRGCDKHCSFCVVPNTRGPQVSRSLEEIEREVRIKVRMGARELLLLGQTVNSYGIDLSPRVRFEALIERLAEIPGLKRIRFTSPHPQEVRPKFIELYGRVPQLCPHIHLPLQSGNDRVLKAMNRNYRVKRYLDIVDKLRDQCGDIGITSDIIVGFPSETDREFRDTLEVMDKVRFISSYSFKYSVRPFTKAPEVFSDEDYVPQEVARERLSELQALQDQHSLEINQSRIGSVVEVFLEGMHPKNKGNMRGRIPQNTLVEVTGENLVRGTFVPVRVEHASPHGLKGSLVES